MPREVPAAIASAFSRKPTLPPDAICELLNMDIKTLRRHVKAGNIRYVHKGVGERRQHREFTLDDVMGFWIRGRGRNVRLQAKELAVLPLRFPAGRSSLSRIDRPDRKAAAEAVERDEIKRAEAQADRLKKQARGPMTFDVAAGRYCCRSRRSYSDRAETERNMARLVEWIGPATLLTDITDDLVARLVARRRGEEKVNAARKKRPGKALAPLGRVSNGQVNRSVTELLRRVLTRARKVWKIALPDEPNWTEHRLPEPRERVRELHYDEEARLEEKERAD